MFFISESPCVDEEDSKRMLSKKLQLETLKTSFGVQGNNNHVQQQQQKQQQMDDGSKDIEKSKETTDVNKLLPGNDSTKVEASSSSSSDSPTGSSDSTISTSSSSSSISLSQSPDKMFEKTPVYKLKKSTSLLSEMLQKEQELTTSNPPSSTFPNRLLRKKKSFPTEWYSSHNQLQSQQQSQQQYQQQYQQQRQQTSKVKPSQVGVAFDGTESLKKDLMKDWEPYLRQRQIESKAPTTATASSSSSDTIEQVIMPSYQSVCKGW